jgi:endonuclease YncB( thermonuclease family)
VIGKKCEFNLEYNYGGREYGTLIVNNENLNLELIKAGLAKVVEKKGNLPASSNYDELMNA